jgi:uncharacterized membrane protein
MPTRLTVLHWVTLTGWAGLAALLFVWNTFLIDRHLHTILGSLAIALLPLLIPLRGLLQGRGRAYILTAMLSLLYFMHGVTEVFAPGANPAAVLEIGFSLTAFIGAASHAHTVRVSATHG